ncbi:kynurenine--oxoglutarate transaminase 3-like [Trichogramma pretiosum]|uniref:kynurenine--oxoglutarate transaminase 3-like n=1 Tax=Trichogramma pretiosum TaxID=7493 RepID=UPI000C71A5CB|nr:kynurenine--oxoglutarate transaminase 3-like [Trichogramma pretiosum]
MKEAFINVAMSPDYHVHQYGRSEGHPRLVKILSKIYSPLVNRELDPYDNFVVSIGATNALFSALQSLTHPDDEWIVFVPHWEHYASMLRMSGAAVKEVLLRPNKDFRCGDSPSSSDWTFDRKELSEAFTEKTKGILLNNPNNPTGKVFDREELTFIADLVKKWDAIALVDEVYEWLVYDGNEHIRFATLPGMFDRTITVGAASKAFSVTGWRVGWAYGPAYLMNYMKKSIYGAAGDNVTPSQVAVATGLERVWAERNQTKSYLVEYPKTLEIKRDRIVEALCKAGFVPHVPQSGFFLLADWTGIKSLPRYLVNNATLANRDVEFVKYMVKEVGLEVYPGSPYFGEKHQSAGRDFVRVCFVKRDDTLDKAVDILAKL